MGRIEWAMWANEQAVISCGVLFLGGTLAVSSNALASSNVHTYWEIGIYAMCVSFIIFIFEYPRGKRQKGNTLQRSGQYIPTKIVSSLSVFGRNYFIRFILYLLACVPCLLNLGSIMGGLGLLVTSCIYLRAAIAGEEWKPCERVVNREKTLTRERPPSMAPPRLNPPATNYTYEGEVNDATDNDQEVYENVQNIKV